MEYTSTKLKNIITIKEIYSIHYFEYMSDFSFEGEKHNFWELLYVDKGEVEVIADEKKFICKSDEIVFHKPNEFHALKANGVVAPNIIVLSFNCVSKKMKFFENKKLIISDNEKNIMAQIILEAKKAFSSPLNKTYLYKLERRNEATLGSEQMIRIYIEQLILSLLRRNTVYKDNNKMEKKGALEIVSKKNYERKTYENIIKYMDENIKETLTIQKICREITISRSALQNMFHNRQKCGVMQYFTIRKIEYGKQLMRNSQMNFTEIADTLGYTSVHYFSRQFKKITGMTPSEYVSSVKRMTEENEKLK